MLPNKLVNSSTISTRVLLFEIKTSKNSATYAGSSVFNEANFAAICCLSLCPSSLSGLNSWTLIRLLSFSVCTSRIEERRWRGQTSLMNSREKKMHLKKEKNYQVFSREKGKISSSRLFPNFFQFWHISCSRDKLRFFSRLTLSVGTTPVGINYHTKT